MPLVKISNGQSGGSGGLVDYLEKENREKEAEKRELWFNQDKSNIRPFEAETKMDNNNKGLSSQEAHFYEIYVAFSKEELKHLDNISGGNIAKKKELIREISRDIMEEYAKGFNKGLKAKNFNYVAKIEENRSYKGTDPEVKEGLVKSGEKKPGDQMHVHILVSRLAYNEEKKRTKCSPQANDKGDKKTAKLNGKAIQRGFNRKEFKEKSEQVFDKKTGFQRSVEQSFAYLNAMKNGSIEVKAEALKNSYLKPKLKIQSKELKVPEITHAPKKSGGLGLK